MGWEDFEEFKEDAKFVAFVEIAFVDKGDCSENHFFAGCSCSHGTKGRNCVHALGAYMRSGVLCSNCPQGCRDSRGIRIRGESFLMRRRWAVSTKSIFIIFLMFCFCLISLLLCLITVLLCLITLCLEICMKINVWIERSLGTLFTCIFTFWTQINTYLAKIIAILAPILAFLFQIIKFNSSSFYFGPKS